MRRLDLRRWRHEQEVLELAAELGAHEEVAATELRRAGSERMMASQMYIAS